MNNIKIKRCSLEDVDKIKYISEKTFSETFAGENTEEDMNNYLKENFSYEQVKSEVENDSSIFYIVEVDENIAAYMKVNFDKAQSEEGYDNTLEVQRIYVLQQYKSKGIGKTLIEKAKDIGLRNKLNYVWLGVWENNFDAIRFYEKQGFVKYDTHIFVLGDDRQTDNLMRYIL